MKERRIKNLRIEFEDFNQKKVFYTHKGKELFIGYFNGFLSNDDIEAERQLAGNKVGDYSSIINLWEMEDKNEF